jgi:starch phosphorylase
MVGITLLHRKGYFQQKLDAAGNQSELPVEWSPDRVLEKQNLVVTIPLEGRQVKIRPWRYQVRGAGGHVVPVYLLDTQLPENSTWDQTLTDTLYGGDNHYRLCQEIVLGMGGLAVLRALGYEKTLQYHMNEGHAALVTLALLEENLKGRGLLNFSDADIDAVRSQCIFTTHTPVSAGHDAFAWDLVRDLLGGERTEALRNIQCCVTGGLDMTHLAMRFSRYINAVALKHQETANGLFPRHSISSITNGVHAVTWTSPPMRALFDKYLPGWRRDNNYLRSAVTIPLHEVRSAHFEAKRQLLDEVRRRNGVELNETVLTLGFARRATAYKRPDLLLSNFDRLIAIARQAGPLQIVFGGKAHPRDSVGKDLIRRIHDAAHHLRHEVPIVYLENYDMALGQTLTSGVDIWVNNPIRPLEASGTSGMKAALNGVPSFSVLDGWWVEGHTEGVTGWSIGDGTEPRNDSSLEIARMYDKLEKTIVPLYYSRTAAFTEVMRWAIALNGSFFNTQRMVSQYAAMAYFPAKEA